MRQIEITMRVNNTLNEVDKILKGHGFKIIRNYRIEDIYLKRSNSKVNKNNIIKVLNNSILLRYVKSKDEIDKKITYKKKDYCRGKVISEIKYNVKIDSIEDAYNFFNEIGFNKLVEVKYDTYVYEKDELELCFQDVENLGLLLEVENDKDFTNASSREILNEKKKMAKNISKLGLDISNDFDVKKAYELIKKFL